MLARKLIDFAEKFIDVRTDEKKLKKDLTIEKNVQKNKLNQVASLLLCIVQNSNCHC